LNNEGMSVLLSREEIEQIDPRYRWLVKWFLKLPNPSFPYPMLRRLPWIEGVFWAVVMPIFLTIYFFVSLLLVSFLSFHFIFPVNVILGLLIPTMFFALFLRIQLERTILWWRNLNKPPIDWDVSKIIEEFVKLTRREKSTANSK